MPRGTMQLTRNRQVFCVKLPCWLAACGGSEFENEEDEGFLSLSVGVIRVWAFYCVMIHYRLVFLKQMSFFSSF